MATPLRCLYTDLDGTLLGAEGSFLHDADGSFSLLAPRAFEACSRAGVEVVVYTGRQRATVYRDARTLGLRSYICEAGACVVLDGEVHWLMDGFTPEGDLSVRDQIVASGAPDRCSSASPGASSTSTPSTRTARPRCCSAATSTPSRPTRCSSGRATATCGCSTTGRSRNARRSCRGSSARARTTCSRARSPRAARSRFHVRARGYSPEECVAVGDSREERRRRGGRQLLAGGRRARARRVDPRGDRRPGERARGRGAQRRRRVRGRDDRAERAPRLKRDELLAPGAAGRAEHQHGPDAARVELVLEDPRLERREVLGHQHAREVAEGHLAPARSG